MPYKQILEKYPERFIIVLPEQRGVEDNKPLTFKVLQTCTTTEACEKAMNYYDLEGFENVIPLPNFIEPVEDLNPKYVARLFRVMHGAA